MYLIGLIPKKIIKDCVEELMQIKDDFSISLLCQLIIYTAKKLFTDSKDILDTAHSFLEKLNQNLDEGNINERDEQ